MAEIFASLYLSKRFNEFRSRELLTNEEIVQFNQRTPNSSFRPIVVQKAFNLLITAEIPGFSWKENLKITSAKCQLKIS